jgi:hypothetical protein
MAMMSWAAAGKQDGGRVGCCGFPSFSWREEGNQPMQAFQNGEPASPQHFNGRGLLSKGEGSHLRVRWWGVTGRGGLGPAAGAAFGTLGVHRAGWQADRETNDVSHWTTARCRHFPGVDAGSGALTCECWSNTARCQWQRCEMECYLLPGNLGPSHCTKLFRIWALLEIDTTSQPVRGSLANWTWTDFTAPGN